MKTRKKKVNGINKTLSGALVVAMLLMLVFTSIGGAMANEPPDEPGGTILYFDQAYQVFEIETKLGTAREDLGLPTELRAIVSIGTQKTTDEIQNEIPDENTDDITNEAPDEIIDEIIDVITNEDADEASNEAADEIANEIADETSNEATDEIIDETIVETAANVSGQNTTAGLMRLSAVKTGTVAANEPETIDINAEEDTTGNNSHTDVVMFNVPVTWEGYYNGDEYGEYILTSRVDGYNYTGEMPIAIITVKPEETTTPVPNSISGFFWVDGNGDMPTDWDGLYNGYEQLLAGFPVSLYRAGDLSTAVAATWTNTNGRFIFENLEPGSYMLGIWGDAVAGIDYLAPIFITSENKFAIDWEVSGYPAYTAVIELADGQAVQDQNAGMRLPMGIQPMRAWSSVAGLKDPTLKVNDEIAIERWTWVVVRIETVQTETGPIKAVYLIMRGARTYNNAFGTSQNYATSTLRNRFTAFYTETGSLGIPTIRAIALRPNLGILSSQTATTEPTGYMAGNQTEDILFAPSLKDMENWVGGTTVPNGHPLSMNPTSGVNFPTRFWFRTPSSYSTDWMTGHYRDTPGFDHGININGYTMIWDVPGVWVNANAVDREINVYYVDTDGVEIHAPYTDSVPIGNDYTLPLLQVLDIGGYEYIEWRKEPSGAAQNISTLPNLTAQEVTNGTDLYLVYNKTAPDLTTVIVGKEVMGEYSSATKPFTFTVYFTDSSGVPLAANTEFSYIGGVMDGYSGVSAPQNDTLKLDGDGKASFLLRHGQMITIQDVPSDVKIKVLEKVENNYIIYYTDSKTGGTYEFYPDMVEFDAVGTAPRTFEFLNIYTGGPPPVPTGVDSGNGLIVAVSLIATLLIGSGMTAIRYIKRRTSRS